MTDSLVIQFTIDLADLLGSPHHTFTQEMMRGMGDKTVPLRKGEGGPQIGYGVIVEDQDTEHLFLYATVTNSPELFADVMSSYSVGFTECTSPLHGRDRHTEDGCALRQMSDKLDVD
jgi:hypothetical protein